MTEHKEGHRKSAAHSARHLARVFVMLGLYQSVSYTHLTLPTTPYV